MLLFFQKGRKDLVPLGKSGKVAKTIFYFLKVDKHNSSKVIVHGAAVYQGDGKGIKVPCRLSFTAEDRFINVMRKRLYNFLQYTVNSYDIDEDTAGDSDSKILSIQYDIDEDTAGEEVNKSEEKDSLKSWLRDTN